MVVTPNLVIEDNFVRREEYPMAREAGKPILPAEMIETDQSLLFEQYPGCRKKRRTIRSIDEYADRHSDAWMRRRS